MTPTKTKKPSKETYRKAAAPSLRIITAFYDDPANRSDFKQWQKAKEQKGAAHA